MPNSFWGRGNVFVDTPLSRTLNRITALSRAVLIAATGLGIASLVHVVIRPKEHTRADKKAIKAAEEVRKMKDVLFTKLSSNVQ